MALLPRLLVVCCFALALAAFAYANRFGLDGAGVEMLAVVAGIGGPLAAAGFSFLAAWRSGGGDRKAWTLFGTGSSLYLAGNLGYVAYALAGVVVPFPSLPEAAFFAMGLFFVVGMFQYGKVRQRVSRIQIYNFVLIYSAVALASLFYLQRSLSASVMPPFGTIVAFLYPVLWWSVTASGLLSLVLYRQGRKSLPLGLMLLALIAEATADSIYVHKLMEGTYQIGGIAQLLWLASAGLIVWAALEQVAIARRPAEAAQTGGRSRGDRAIAEAAIPATAVGIILVSGSVSGVLGTGPYASFAIALSIGFAIIAGFREHWVIYTQRQLRRAIESSRSDLARSQQRISAVLESTSDSVIVVDRDWQISYFNRHAVTSVGDSASLVLGANLWDIFPSEKGTPTSDRYRQAMATQEPAEMEERFGDTWFEINAYPTEDGLAIFFRNISERRQAREAITYMAHHDALTGLASRAVFQERLQQAASDGEGVATLLVDLDHFKDVNDSLGHPVGDATLTETARRLLACVRPTDTVARLGGDEFAVIATGAPAMAEVRRLAQRIIGTVSALYTVEGHSIRLGASVGISMSSGPEADAGEVFRQADIALYAAKSEARGAYRFFEPEMERGLQERQALRADLAAALENRELELAYQPIVDLATRGVSGFEALLRWRHPVHGLIAPDVFIPIAEDSGLIVPIGEWVLRTACAEAAGWPAGISVAVNLSSRQFAGGDLAKRIAVALRQGGLAPERLEVEITESVLFEDSKANMKTLRRLREMGLRIALDDFGTGFSSLGYLQRFPFTKIKIDRSFISGLPENEESQAIVRSVIGLGRSLHMRVTAEGVETGAQLDWVAAGCDEAQGYFFSRPVAAGDIPALLDRLGAVDWAGDRARRAG